MKPTKSNFPCRGSHLKVFWKAACGKHTLETNQFLELCQTSIRIFPRVLNTPQKVSNNIEKFQGRHPSCWLSLLKLDVFIQAILQKMSTTRNSFPSKFQNFKKRSFFWNVWAAASAKWKFWTCTTQDVQGLLSLRASILQHGKSQRRIWDPAKDLWWSFIAKIINS